MPKTPYELVRSILQKTPGDRLWSPGDTQQVMWQKIVRNRGETVTPIETTPTLVRRFYKSLGGTTEANDYMTLLRRSAQLVGATTGGYETEYSLLKKLEEAYD